MPSSIAFAAPRCRTSRPRATFRSDRTAPTPSLRVLLADDNATNQRLVRAASRAAASPITAVDNGRDAVAKAAAEPFDLILMDVQMPEMNGFEATVGDPRAGAHDGRHTPIVAMTAHAMTGDREKCLAAGMDAYLSKPLRPDDLAATLGALFPSHGRRAGAPMRLRLARHQRRRRSPRPSSWQISVTTRRSLPKSLACFFPMRRSISRDPHDLRVPGSSRHWRLQPTRSRDRSVCSRARSIRSRARAGAGAKAGDRGRGRWRRRRELESEMHPRLCQELEALRQKFTRRPDDVSDQRV